MADQIMEQPDHIVEFQSPCRRLFSGDEDHLVTMIRVYFFERLLHEIWKGIQAKTVAFYIFKFEHLQIGFQDPITEHDQVAM